VLQPTDGTPDAYVGAVAVAAMHGRGRVMVAVPDDGSAAAPSGSGTVVEPTPTSVFGRVDAGGRCGLMPRYDLKAFLGQAAPAVGQR